MPCYTMVLLGIPRKGHSNAGCPRRTAAVTAYASEARLGLAAAGWARNHQLPPAHAGPATGSCLHLQEDEAVREYIRKHHGTLEVGIDHIDFRAAAKALKQAIDRTTKQIRERYENARRCSSLVLLG